MEFCKKGLQLEENWKKIFNSYKNKYPELAEEYLRRIKKQLPIKWYKETEDYIFNLQKNLKFLQVERLLKIL